MKLKIFAIASLLTLSFAFGLSPVFAYNDAGLENTVNNVGPAGTAMKNMGSIDNSVASVIGTVLSFVGVAFLILMIYGGILWMISQGDTAQIKKAKDIIINGVIGLIIVIFAYAITAYIGKTITTPSTPSTPVDQTPVNSPNSGGYNGPAN
ncbi:MAG: hypothetical protein NT165_02230 [Candidatus Falkowbacteria bacterium]|nr:hypothetical protein [Candidatus Falkowbacteria bacterium]